MPRPMRATPAIAIGTDGASAISSMPASMDARKIANTAHDPAGSANAECEATVHMCGSDIYGFPFLWPATSIGKSRFLNKYPNKGTYPCFCTNPGIELKSSLH